MERIHSELDDLLTRIRAHPYVVAALSGTLEHSAAVRWIMCAGRESRLFPSILENILAMIDGPTELRNLLLENLNDELGNGDPDQAHFVHYQHLLDELSIPREEFAAYQPAGGVKYLLDISKGVACSSPAVAVGYMLANESVTEVTYGALETALRSYYPELSTPFFRLHIDGDGKHVADLITGAKLLFDSGDAAALEDDMSFGMALGERGMAVLLDEAYGVLDSPAWVDAVT